MKRALLIADLEGVAGVDAMEDLIAGSPGYPHACELLTAELNAAIEGLLAAGFDAVRVSDSHLSGSGEPNVLRARLHPAAELCFEEDWYSPRMFDGVAAVACAGMHAAAGMAGFAPHTVDVLGVWELGGRRLSETDLVLGLAAEAGVPGVFVSGDDRLEGSIDGRVAYVRTKEALSVSRARSRDPRDVRALLSRAAEQSPRALPALADGPLVLTFKSGRQAELAAETGARRLDRYRVQVEGRSFRERYVRALRACSAATRVLGDAIRGEPGAPEFAEDAIALFRLPALPDPVPSYADAAGRALRAFLALTARPDEQAVALRALTLHMLEGHAPRLFARWELKSVLDEAVSALAAVSAAFPPGLDADDGMARIDALYVRRERGLDHPAPEPLALTRYLEHLDGDGYGIHAWLIGELAAASGAAGRLSFPDRPLRGQSRAGDLYWLTHLYLLDSRYLRAQLGDPRAAAWNEELMVAAPWLAATGQADLGAEVAFCLQLAGEAGSGAHRLLLEMLVARQREDGRLLDQASEANPEDTGAHTTAAALLALAGAEERRTAGSPNGPEAA